MVYVCVKCSPLTGLSPTIPFKISYVFLCLNGFFPQRTDLWRPSKYSYCNIWILQFKWNLVCARSQHSHTKLNKFVLRPMWTLQCSGTSKYNNGSTKCRLWDLRCGNLLSTGSSMHEIMEPNIVSQNKSNAVLLQPFLNWGLAFVTGKTSTCVHTCKPFLVAFLGEFSNAMTIDHVSTDAVYSNGLVKTWFLRFGVSHHNGGTIKYSKWTESLVVLHHLNAYFFKHFGASSGQIISY